MWINVVGSLVTLATCVALGATQDPCEPGNYAELNDPHRSVKNRIWYPIQGDCDIQLERRWYRFTSPAGGVMPETCVPRYHCGTVAPAWLNGTHPNVTEGIVQRTVCAHYGRLSLLVGNCCTDDWTIEVKNCGDFYVYKLEPVPECPMYYCAGDQEVCRTDQQWSLTGMPPCKEGLFPLLGGRPFLRGPEMRNGSFWFSCEFDLPVQDPDHMFEVVWTIDAESIWKNLLFDPDRVVYFNGSLLKGYLGTNFGCKIRANYRGSGVASPWFSSNPYFVGLQTEPATLEISQREELPSVQLTSTIPLLCTNPPQQQCCLTLKMEVKGPRENLATARDCIYKLCAKENVSDTASVNIPLFAVRDLVNFGDVQLTVYFDDVVAENGGRDLSVFEGYRAQTTLIAVRDVEMPSCAWIGDLHVHSLESSVSFHLYTVGDYTMYETLGRSFEVQARTWPCNGGNVTCVCGVIIREINDIIRIDQCDQLHGSPYTSPLVTVYRQPLREGTVIQRSTDGSQIAVSLPSGVGVSVDARSWGLNVHLLVPPIDEGSGRGICGTFDGDPSNEFTHRNGYVDVANLIPTNFTESWRNNRTLSLFENIPQELATPSDTRFCSCDTGSAGTAQVNCTAKGHVTNVAISCPNCVDITDNITVVRRDEDSTNTTDRNEPDVRFDPDNFADFQAGNPTWPSPSNITEEQAYANCLQALLSSQLWSHCRENSKLVNSSVHDCVADVLFADTYDLLESAQAAFNTECQIQVSRDPDNYVTAYTREIILKPEFSMYICSAACLRHGNCSNGRCVCEAGYTGDNCHLLTAQGPQLSRIRNSSTCDASNRPCRKIFIDSTNIALSDQLACRVQEILPIGSISPEVFIEEGEFVSAGRLACSIPDARVKSDRSVKIYVISATNDGTVYGNQLNLTVYDSRCRTCDGTSCDQKTTACLINNLCYENGERNPGNASEVCRVAFSTSEWMALAAVSEAFPAISAVSLSRSPSNETLLVCTVSTDDTAPTARYRISWGLDGVWGDEREVNGGHLEATVSTSDFNTAGQVACRARSYYSDRNILSPFAISNVISLANDRTA